MRTIPTICRRTGYREDSGFIPRRGAERLKREETSEAGNDTGTRKSRSSIRNIRYGNAPSSRTVRSEMLQNAPSGKREFRLFLPEIQFSPNENQIGLPRQPEKPFPVAAVPARRTKELLPVKNTKYRKSPSFHRSNPLLQSEIITPSKIKSDLQHNQESPSQTLPRSGKAHKRAPPCKKHKISQKSIVPQEQPSVTIRDRHTRRLQTPSALLRENTKTCGKSPLSDNVPAAAIKNRRGILLSGFLFDKFRTTAAGCVHPV